MKKLNFELGAGDATIILREAKAFEHAHSSIWEVRKKILATSAKLSKTYDI